MTIRKTVYVDASGDATETIGVFETSDYVDLSTGTAEAGKPIKTTSNIAIVSDNHLGDPDTITIAGDKTALFPVGKTFVVSGSTANDGTYTVASSAYSSPNTTITIVESLVDSSGDGLIEGGLIHPSLMDLATLDHDEMLNYDIAEHRTINDSGSASTELWSASKIDTEFDRVDGIFTAMEEPTGFADRSESTLSFVGSTTRELTITRTGASYDIYSNGVKTTITTDDSIAIDNVAGIHYIYYNGNTLSKTTSWDDRLLKGPWVIVAIILWDSTNTKAVLVGDERHGLSMDGTTHSYLHNTVGTQYESGFDISGYTLDTDSDAAVSVGLTGGVVWDEDLKVSITHAASPSNNFEQILSDPGQIPVVYRDGATGPWTKDTATNFPFKNTSSGRVNYNSESGGTWAQTQLTDGYFTEVWVMATTSVDEPIVAIQGWEQFATENDANTGQISRLGSIISAFSFPEFKPLFRIVLESDDTFTTGARKAKIVSIEDFRSTGVASNISAGVTDHGGLGGLTDPDHPATAITVSTSSFGGILDSSDTLVQSALDTIDDHLHDDRYFTESEHLNSSAGAGDAGKPIKLDAAGHIDASMVNDADVSHDSTGGMAASTGHTAFPLLTGTRDYTGIQAYDSPKTFTLDDQLIDKKYVDDVAAELGTQAEWQNSVLDVQTDATLDPGATPTTGDRYILEDVSSLHTNFGTISGVADDDIVQYSGSAFIIAYSPTVGTWTSDDTDPNNLLYFTGTAWTSKGFEATTASLGCKKVNLDIQADLSVGNGLALTGVNSMFVDAAAIIGEGLTTTGVDPSKNIIVDWSTAFNDAKVVKAEDLNSSTAGEGAGIIGLESGAGTTLDEYMTGTDVQAALEEFATQIGGDTSTTYDFTTNGAVLTDNDAVYTALDKLNEKWIDLANTVSGEGAGLVGIYDSGTKYTGTDVQAILDELFSQIGGATTATYDFTTNGLVLTDNESVYICLNKLNEKWGDLANTASGEGAGLVGIYDSGGYTTETDVEGALQELFEKTEEMGITFTTGENVAKGDLLYVSANNTVSKLDITDTPGEFGIGIAADTVTLGNPVKVLANDTVVAGVLSTATAGDKYYWTFNGTTGGWSTTLPTAAGNYVWLGLVAKNADDAYVHVEFVMRRS